MQELKHIVELTLHDLSSYIVDAFTLKSIKYINILINELVEVCIQNKDNKDIIQFIDNNQLGIFCLDIKFKNNNLDEKIKTCVKIVSLKLITFTINSTHLSRCRKIRIKHINNTLPFIFSKDIYKFLKNVIINYNYIDMIQLQKYNRTYGKNKIEKITIVL